MSLDIDLSGVQATGGPIPAGIYNVVIDKAEVAPTRSGGEMIKAQLKIMDGEQAGRIIFDSWNIKNANPQAVQIGLGQLKGMMKAFGHPNPNKLASVTELVGLKGSVSTKIEETPGYDPQARVKAYKSLSTPAATGTESTPIQKDPFS